MPDSNTPRRPGLGWTGLIGVAISVVLLWWTLRDVAIADVLSQLRGARILPLVGTVVVATLTFPIRTARWQYLLRDDLFLH